MLILKNSGKLKRINSGKLDPQSSDSHSVKGGDKQEKKKKNRIITDHIQHFPGMILPALSDSSSPADMITGSTPMVLKMSSV